MTKAFITGINGFVGKYLKDHLEKKNIEVYGVLIEKNKEKNIIQCNILDKEKIKTTISNIKPNIIYHLAAQSSVKSSLENPELTKKINVEGTRNVIEACKNLDNNPRIIFISSGEVYGKNDGRKLKETDELHPLNPYSESKLEAEKLFKEYDIDTVTLRPFPHAGPGLPEDKVCSSFAKQIAEIEKKKKEKIRVGNL